jgi:hypothetical protein
MSCDNDCRQAPAFPKPIFNRPGLSTIDYRIGSYADLREHMLGLLDASPTLAAWTHRLPDDPGIALIEAAAEVGDILSFYQDLYANEAYLRSAKWRDSVADLVRLLGYRLAPGLAGRARFAFAVKGEQPVLLPAGLGLKAQLESDGKPSVFETSAELIAQPALSRFHLYRPRRVPEIQYGADTFTLVLDAGASVALKAGDRLMVGVARDSSGAFDHTQVLVVDKTWESFGSTVVKMKGGITSLKQPPQFHRLPQLSQPSSRSSPSLAATVAARGLSIGTVTAVQASALAPQFIGSALLATLAAGLGQATLGSTPRLRAWKLGGTHRHFGHGAPTRQVNVDAKGRATTSDVSYQRRLDTTTTSTVVPALSATQMPLDGEVSSVVAGTRILVEANLGASASDLGRKRLLERRVAQVDRQSLAWGPLTGASTVASLDQSLAITESGTTLGHADIRGMSFHEVVGEPFELQADFVPTAAARGAEFYFYGSEPEAAALAGRSLLFIGPDQAQVSVTALAAETVPADTSAEAGRPGFHRVRLDREFDYAQFGYEAPQFTVYGNLVEATQGKTEAPLALGDGDGRAVFQTFALPKTPNEPLSYLLDTTQVPPQLAQLQVWVDGVEWTRVDSLFGRGPKEHVYIVREDADGRSWVQFGDGKTGSRLRSGRGNVVASYRTGSGAHGPLKPDAKPQIDKKVSGLDAAFLLEPVTGGAPPETAEGARVAAPGTMQSLGRIVSLADYEAEALAIAGVIKARAAWVSVDGAPLVRVTILTDSNSAADASAAADALRAAVRARGAGRCPLLVVSGARAQVSLELTVGHDPTLRAEDLRVAILQALGATGLEGNGVDSARGLFSWEQRQFGEGVHGSQVVAVVQNVPGVAWVRLTALAAAGPHLFLPRIRALATQRSLACAGDQLLALEAGALQLQLAAAKEGLPS